MRNTTKTTTNVVFTLCVNEAIACGADVRFRFLEAMRHLRLCAMAIPATLATEADAMYLRGRQLLSLGTKAAKPAGSSQPSSLQRLWFGQLVLAPCA